MERGLRQKLIDLTPTRHLECRCFIFNFPRTHVRSARHRPRHLLFILSFVVANRCISLEEASGASEIRACRSAQSNFPGFGTLLKWKNRCLQLDAARCRPAALFALHACSFSLRTDLSLCACALTPVLSLLLSLSLSLSFSLSFSLSLFLSLSLSVLSLHREKKGRFNTIVTKLRAMCFPDINFAKRPPLALEPEPEEEEVRRRTRGAGGTTSNSSEILPERNVAEIVSAEVEMPEKSQAAVKEAANKTQKQIQRKPKTQGLQRKKKKDEEEGTADEEEDKEHEEQGHVSTSEEDSECDEGQKEIQKTEAARAKEARIEEARRAREARVKARARRAVTEEVHTRMHACTHACTQARMHACTYARSASAARRAALALVPGLPRGNLVAGGCRQGERERSRVSEQTRTASCAQRGQPGLPPGTPHVHATRVSAYTHTRHTHDTPTHGRGSRSKHSRRSRCKPWRKKPSE